MRRAVLAAALIASGCARVATVSHEPVPVAARRAPMRPSIPAMDRQVSNAVDAGEGDPIVRELRRRLTANPDDVKARLEIVARYQSQGFPEIAIEHLRLAAARAPRLSELQIRLAKALHATGADSDAIATLENCYRGQSPAPVELVSLLGIYEDETGRHADAEAHHRAAAALAPAKDTVHNNLGYNLLLQGRMEEAVGEFRRAVALNPRSETARDNLGMALARMPGGDRNEALMHWQSVSGPATAHNNLASVLIEQKSYAEAKKELEIALGYSRNHEAALSNLALIGVLEGRPAGVTLANPRAKRAGLWRIFGRRTKADAAIRTAERK